MRFRCRRRWKRSSATTTLRVAFTALSIDKIIRALLGPERKVMAAKRDREKSPERPARPERPELPRAEPIRSWAGLFGPGGRSGSARSAVDSVQRGVEVGYRVIDEYMKQGASMAGS